MILYAFDLYPRDDPRDGARLVRMVYTGTEGALQSAEYRAEANGTGSGRISIRAGTTIADFIDPLGLQYVRVVEIDTDTVDGATTSGFAEKVVGGFWLENGDFETLNTNQTRLLTFGGPGTLAYLAREVLWSRAYTYTSDNIVDADGTWNFYNQASITGGDWLGAVLFRVITEAQSFASPVVEDDDKPDTAIIDLVLTSFGLNNDSAGNAWTVPSGEFKAQTGDNILTIVRRLMEAGMYVEINPDTFVLHVWERGAANDRGDDKTGAAWAAEDPITFKRTVRFQAPTDGTVATGNILSDAKRGIGAFVTASTVLAGDRGTFVARSDAAVGVKWHRHHPFDAQDADTLTFAGDSQLAARGDAADTLRLRFKLGTDPTIGEYRPLMDYNPAGTEPDATIMLNDLVTVHTGTGQWDYNEDTFPVSALTIALRPGGDWDAWADLGSTYTSMAERAFQAKGVATHSHPPSQLCQSGTAAGPASFVRSADTGGNSTPAGLAIEVGAESDRAFYMAIMFGAVSSADADAITATWRPNGIASSAGEQALTLIGQTAAGTNIRIQLYRLTAPNTSAGSGAIRLVLNNIGLWSVGAWYLAGVNQTTPEGTVATNTGTGTASSLTITAGAGDLSINAGGYWHTSAGADPTIVAGQTEDFARNDTTLGDFTAIGGGHSDATPGWEFGASKDWHAIGVAVNGSGGSASVNDGHADLVGTSSRAARCDHRHDVHRDTAPTVNDDSADGYKLGTVWAQLDDLDTPTEIVGTWMLVDTTEGAAVWLDLAGAGVTDHGALTGLADDDHPQYALKSSVVTDHGSMGAAETFDFTNGSDHEGTQDANLTVTLTGATDDEAAWLTLKLTQDATGGRTLTLPASVTTKATVEADWDTTALAVNVLTLFSYDGGVTWYAFLAGSGSVSADDVRDAGRWEALLTEDGTEVITTEDGLDWLYVWVTD